MLIELDQRTNEWLEWRDKGITSSDIVQTWFNASFDDILMWLKKKCSKERTLASDNIHIKRGIYYEPIVRDLVNHRFSKRFLPRCGVNDEHTWAISSFDGIDLEESIVLEIKCPSKFNYSKLSEEFSFKHFVQLQWHGLVFGRAKQLWLVYYESESGNIQLYRFDPDQRLQEMLLHFGKRLYKCYQRSLETMNPEQAIKEIFQDGVTK